MLARLRCLGTGAVLGVGIGKVAQAVLSELEDNPDALRNALGPVGVKMFGAGASSTTAAKDDNDNSSPPPPKKKTVALIRMSGQIAAPSSSPLGGGGDKINIARFEQSLNRAFETPDIAAVAIEMNSPGGSPVQSALLHNRLRALKKEHPNVPLLCYCTDLCASGGYYIASACDEIHVLPSTIVGSIGVVSPGLGVVGLLKQYGVEDRTMTAGTSKAGDSPLLPRDPVAMAQKQRLLEELHDDFKQQVTAARGERLQHGKAYDYQYRLGERKSRKARAEALFDGSVYAGRTAVELGLADGLYEEMPSALKARLGGEVRVRELKTKVGLFEKLQALQTTGAEANAAALWRGARLELARANASGAELEVA